MNENAAKVALVTGANRGIGLACVEALRDAGFQAVGTYRTAHPEVEGVSWVQCDVTNGDSVNGAFDQIESEFGPPAVVVANAGVTRDMLLMEMKEDDFFAVLDANLAGTFRVVQRAIGKMSRARWGRIIVMSSISGRAGQPGQANYAASKAGLIGFARSVAKEYGKRNVTVNIIAPGPIDTDMIETVTTEMKQMMESAVPLRRIGAASEVASAVCWLASDGAAYTTGAIIPVDGGMFMSS